MKLYYTPGACSMASHITLREAGADFTIEAVDLKAKTTASGGNYLEISPRGAVPALQLDDGSVLTEGVAIMQHVMDSLKPGALPASGTLARARLQEALSFLSSELQKTYTPFFMGITDEARPAQVKLLDSRLKLVEDMLADGREWLAGDSYTPADAYLFTVTSWSGFLGHDLSAFPHILALRKKVAARPAVQETLKAEGLIK